jgi:glycosyltransferase involved in cell wall biosynthesis
MKKLNILISAYACNPYLGSENQVGWNIVYRLSKFHNLTVLTEYSNKKNINIFFNNKKNKIKFHFIKRKRYFFLEKLWPPSYYWSYKTWQKKAFKKTTEIDLKKIDLCHQLNMIGLREPGYLWKLNIPFIYGPIGGLSFYSKKLMFNSGIFIFIYSLFYNLIRFLDIKFAFRSKSALYKAGNFVLAANSDTQKNLKKYFKVNSNLFLPVGNENKITDITKFKKKKNQIDIFWGGLHIPRKSLNIGLEALSKLPSNINWKLHITGKGKLSDEWKNLSIKKNIDKKCIFYGYLKNKKDLPKIMKKCDIHLFTSIKEDTPAIIMETMALGLPTICFDLYGAKDLVNQKRGIKIIPNYNYDENILNFKKAILKIINSKQKKIYFAKNCQNFSKENTWDNKISILNFYYQKIKKLN